MVAKKVVVPATVVAGSSAPAGFTEIGGAGNTTYPKYAQHKSGDVLITDGVYLGSVPSKFGGVGHPFKMADGTKIHLNGAGQLDRRLEGVSVGTHCHIVYMGEEVLNKGPFKGKPCHQFKVLAGGVEAVAAQAVKSTVEDLDISL
jgi:hypothetical protein